MYRRTCDDEVIQKLMLFRAHRPMTELLILYLDAQLRSSMLSPRWHLGANDTLYVLATAESQQGIYFQCIPTNEGCAVYQFSYA